MMQKVKKNIKKGAKVYLINEIIFTQISNIKKT